MREIGIVGTFDVQNFGDLLFPLIAERELERRLGPIKLHRFSYHAKRPPDWPFVVSAVTDLPGKLPDLSGLLVGGGHIIRFDKNIAPGYLPSDKAVHHPTGYWLMPALNALHRGCPVVWNCPSASQEIPAWSEPLMRAAFQHSDYVAARDEPTRQTLLRFASDVAVVPDTCFGISALVDTNRPSPAYLELKGAIGLTKPYILVQPVHKTVGFGEFIRRNREQFSGYQFVSVPIGPCHGDSDIVIAEAFDDLITLASWPAPLLLAEFIAGASAVVGDSLHLAITALSFDLPVFRPGSDLDGKYVFLNAYENVNRCKDDWDIDPAWFERKLTERTTCPTREDSLIALNHHWDTVARLFSLQEKTGGSETSLASLVQRLPGLLEHRAELTERAELAELEHGAELADRQRQIDQLNAVVQARDDEICALRESTSWKITSGLRAIKTIANRRVRSPAIVKFDELSRAKLNKSPFDWAFVNNLFSQSDAQSLAATYPCDSYKTVKGFDGEKGYEYEARPLIHMGSNSIEFSNELSPAWRRLAIDLLSPNYREAVSTLTKIDLTRVPMEAYVCHFGDGAWLGPHVDLKDKIMTHVFYFNEHWDSKNGGCLNILRSSNISDTVAEITPVVGNSSVLVRSGNSWHSVSPVVNGSHTSRRSMNVIFYHPGAKSTMWPPNDKTPLHRFEPAKAYQ